MRLNSTAPTAICCVVYTSDPRGTLNHSRCPNTSRGLYRNGNPYDTRLHAMCHYHAHHENEVNGVSSQSETYAADARALAEFWQTERLQVARQLIEDMRSAIDADADTTTD